MQTDTQEAEKVMQGLRGIAYAAADEIRPGERLRALELLGKQYGLFRENAPQAAGEGEILSLLLKELRTPKRRRGAGRA